MAQVIYQNENAVLSFDYDDLVCELRGRLSMHDGDEHRHLLEWCEERSQQGQESITINGTHTMDEFPFASCIQGIICALLSDEKGYVYCKECNTNVPAWARKKTQATSTGPTDNGDGQEFSSLEEYLHHNGKLPLAEPSTETAFFCDKGHQLFAA